MWVLLGYPFNLWEKYYGLCFQQTDITENTLIILKQRQTLWNFWLSTNDLAVYQQL